MDDSPTYETLDHTARGGGIVKLWARHVKVEEQARQQLLNVTTLPFIHSHVAAMPDVHWGMGATVGSVIPTRRAIVPAAVGVDIGCGMCAMRTSLTAADLPDNLKPLRLQIEGAVPHGRARRGKDHGAWSSGIPNPVGRAWRGLEHDFGELVDKYPHLGRTNNVKHLGTLGTGNHFIEICLDEEQRVWVMLHSGSRGVGNAIGRTFIDKAQKQARKGNITLVDENLAYLDEGTELFDHYWGALSWAQDYARLNRSLMLDRVLDTLRKSKELPGFKTDKTAINCHHNYSVVEHHFGEDVYVTRKGAIRAGLGELGIIPGSMGAKSFIVRGKGNPDSFESCSHGAGRAMSRGRAKHMISLDDHIAATKGVECRKDKDVLDESPAAYKSIEDVMRSQDDLVETVHTLKQVICVKG
jgi:tRNA-splicing ligase RtcB